MKLKSNFIKHKIVVSSWILMSCLIGCQTYRPMSLNKESVANKLKAPNWDELKIASSKIKHPILKPVELDLRDGLSPDEAAVIAVLVNPSLNSARDEREIAAGQVMDAGLLPNPQLSYSMDIPSGGNTEGTVNAYGLGVNWDINNLITRRTRVKIASATQKSIELDIAWQEWQTAEGARLAVYDILYLESQDSVARQIEERQIENLTRVKRAYDLYDVTQADLSEAEIGVHNAHSTVLELEQEIGKQRLMLNRTLGVPPETKFNLQQNKTPIDFSKTPSAAELVAGLEDRRLDLLALKQGYESEESRYHQAIMEQFPKINVGVNKAGDTGNLKTTGFGITIDLPIFNHNQGQIAIEKATRQKLFDEYVNRLFESRSQIYVILADMNALKKEIQHKEQGIETLKKLIESYKTAFGQENIDILTYYNSQKDLADKTTELIKSHQELQDLHIALEIESGQYIQ